MLLFILSSLPLTNSGNRQSGLHLDSNPPVSNSDTFYPYLTNATSYPSPDQLASPIGGTNYSFPKIATAIISQVPTFLLVGQTLSGNGSGRVYFQSGVYSASAAKAILNGTTASHIPIQWSAPTPVTPWERGVQDAVLATSGDGSEILVAVSWG